LPRNMVVEIHASELTLKELEELKREHTVEIFGDSILIFI